MGMSGGKGCIGESPTKFRRATDRIPSAPCRVRWHALTEPSSRHRKNCRSEVETKRARLLCERHLRPFCHTTRQSDRPIRHDLCHTSGELDFSNKPPRSFGKLPCPARTSISKTDLPIFYLRSNTANPSHPKSNTMAGNLDGG